MKIKLKILTPVHIGSGQEISPLEYLIHNNKFIRIDMDSLFLDPDFKPLQDKFINSAKFQRYIGNLLPKDLLLKHILYSLDISNTAKGTNPIVVKEFIKSAGRVYIPGSSLKGSILSGVIEEVLFNKKIKELSNFENHLSEVLSEITKSPQGRFSHWFDLKDSNFFPPEESLEIIQVKVMGGRRGQLPILYEALKENLEFETEVISHPYSHKSEKEILQMADTFYRKVYNKEREYIQKTKLPIQLPSISSDSFLLRIGQGSTAWSTSFLILADELGIKYYTIQRPKFHKIKGPPQTRKLISGTKSMGWVEVKSYA